MQLQYKAWTQDPGNIMEEGAEQLQEPEDQEVCEIELSSYDREPVPKDSQQPDFLKKIWAF